MSNETSPARAAFDAWCEAPQYLRERARRRQRWDAFLAGWIASQAPRPLNDESQVIEAALRWRAAVRASGDVMTRTDELLEQVETLDRARTKSRKNSRTDSEFAGKPLNHRWIERWD
jgi:hypothetical protein